MRARLQYGAEGIEVDLPSSNLTILEPRFLPGLPDEAAAFREAVAGPSPAHRCKDVVRAPDRVAIASPT